MRLNNSRMLQKNMRSQAQESIEMIDGIVWNVDTTNEFCEIRVQDNTAALRAFYPQSLSYAPSWLRRGAPVMIRMTGGIRSQFEIMGPGQVIPTPNIGENTFPDSTTPLNCLTSGCQVTQIPNVPQMSVLIEVGEYRIDGTTYSLDAIKMDSTLYTMDMGGLIDHIATVCTVSAAPTDIGEYRYDIFVAGTDEDVDYVVGTTFRTTAVVPDVPANHVLLSKILLHKGTTQIVNQDINHEWDYQGPKSIKLVPDLTTMEWTDTQTTVTVSVYDQYNNAIALDMYGWYITLEFEEGNGSLYSTYTGNSTSLVAGYCGTSNEIKFVYTRGLTTADESPKFKATLHSNYQIELQKGIILRSSGGDIMTS